MYFARIMLLDDHQLHYRELRKHLEELRQEGGVDWQDAVSLRKTVDRIQEFFQTYVLSLPMEGLNQADQFRTQSCHTELHKQLRLLATDVLLLGSARKTVTLQQRQAQLSDRLTILLRYCDILLGEDFPIKP